METEELASRIHRPAQLLKDVVQKLVHGQVPTTTARLDELYEHIHGCLEEVLGYGQEQLSVAAGLLEEGQVGQEITSEYAEIQDQVTGVLQHMRATFFCSRSFAELQDNLGHWEVGQSQLEAALQRLEAFVFRMQDAELLRPPVFTPHPAVPEALNELAGCLECLNGHLLEGRAEALAEGFRRLEQARALLLEAMQS